MDRLASCHLMHGFLHVSGNRHRHPTAPACQNVRVTQRSLSLADRRGIISPAWTARRGLISPAPRTHAIHAARHINDEMDGGRMKKIYNMSLMMQIVDVSHLSALSRGNCITSTSAAVTADAALPTAEMSVMPSMQEPVHTTRVLPWNYRQQSRSYHQQRRSIMTCGNFSAASARRRSLKPPELRAEVGDVLLSLCYFPQLSKLIVTVVQARDLPGRDKFSNTDPYVKMWLVEKGRRIEKRKTSVSPQTQEPMYNKTFSFSNLPEREVLRYDVNLVVTVMDYDLMASNEEIGHVIIGALGGEDGLRHWNETLNSADFAVTCWHRLTPKL